MADAAITFLLENMKLLALGHVDLISGAENELKQLENELGIMKTFLKDASKKQNKDELLKELETQIRDVVYDVEDVIDSCITKQSTVIKTKKSTDFLGRGKRRLDLGNEVKSVREQKVKSVMERINNANLAESFNAKEEDVRDKWKKPPRQESVIGFEDEIERLLEYLREDSTGLDVVSIVGMPGLGKTTVAWKIYSHPKIQNEFPTLIWIYVSQTFNKKNMLLTILKMFTQEDMSSKTVEELEPKVREYLKRGKFLIFMDDVWTTEVWDEMRGILPKENHIGKVLITSRHEKVSWHANRKRLPYRLRFLNDNESWELLQFEIFGKLGDCPPELEIVGKHIAHECGGLPLSIIVIGGILVEKFSTIKGGIMAIKRGWEKVSESVKTDLMHQYKGDRLKKFISLSYTELPHALRDCFLYLGMFPGNTEIPVWKLIRLWIAEGFIPQSQGQSSEETSLDNLKDLINRNLVMIKETKPDGEVRTCCVHDTIREFCKNEAALKNQNLFQEVIMSKDGVFEPPVQGIQKYRRLCIHSYVEEFLSKKPKVPHTRSFFCFSKAPINLQNKDISSITEAFEVIRILEAGTINFPKFPTKFLSLVHLRYLTLSGNEFNILPHDISKLWNLQTLVVNTLCRTLEIKATIWNMSQLRHVKTKAAIILDNDGKGEGSENLQTLTRLSPKSCTSNVFEKAKNLKSLGIRGPLTELLDSKCLGKLGRLEKLKLVNDVFPKGALENPMLGISMTFPPKMRVLTLSATYLDWTCMSALGKLSSTLEVLKLKDNAFVGNSWEAVAGGFHQLEFLYITRTDLRYWVADNNAFPKLRSLVLENCENLERVPIEIGMNLEMLSLTRVTKYLVSSAIRIKEKKDMARKQKEGHQKSKWGEFKLIIENEVKSGSQPLMARTNLASLQKDSKKSNAAGNESNRLELSKEYNQIKDRLTGSSPQLSTISIFGMGGIGKTTLAKSLYNDPLITGHFVIFGWLTISPKYDKKEMIIRLLDSIGPGSAMLDKKDIEELEVMFCQSLYKRRYIIVMDDVWDTEAVDYVRSKIPEDCNGSRIVLTTRDLKVANHTYNLNTIHEMRALSYDESWNLFLEKVFKQNSCPPELEIFGKLIVENCSGLPLAIVVISGHLSKVDKTQELWKYVADNTRLELSKKNDHFVKILSLGYDTLPQHLKECFLYMGIFFEGREIRVSHLIKLWIAEGFLVPVQDRSLEEVAYLTLNELIDRSFIQVGRVSCIGEIKSCRIHDLLRDLCIQKANEEKFLAVLKNESYWLHPEGRECLTTHQRVSIQFHVRSYPTEVPNSIQTSPVRSLLHFGETYSLNCFLSFTMNFQSLWVLDAPLVRFDDELLVHVFDLVNLRFLAFSVKKNTELPEEISKLINLQTLMVLCSKYRIGLPYGIWEMPQLTHILVENCFFCSTPIHGSNVVLENLQTLSKVFHWEFTDVHLVMPNLKKLVISNIYISKLVETFDKSSFVQLETLKCYFINDRERYGLKRYESEPQPQLQVKFAFPKSLKKLTLSGCGLPWEKLTVVGSLPNLEVLKLEDNAFTGPVWESNDGEFCQLKSLILIKNDLEEWRTDEADFPSLEHLSLNCCSDLLEIPSAIGDIPTLKIIEVYDCKASAADSAESIKEEQQSSGNTGLIVRVIRADIIDNNTPIGSYMRKRIMHLF